MPRSAVTTHTAGACTLALGQCRLSLQSAPLRLPPCRRPAAALRRAGLLHQARSVGGQLRLVSQCVSVASLAKHPASLWCGGRRERHPCACGSSRERQQSWHTGPRGRTACCPPPLASWLHGCRCRSGITQDQCLPRDCWLCKVGRCRADCARCQACDSRHVHHSVLGGLWCREQPQAPFGLLPVQVGPLLSVWGALLPSAAVEWHRTV